MRQARRLERLIETENCSEFVTRADPFDVTHVLLVDGMTPSIVDGACGLRKVFDAAPFTILSRVPDAPTGALTALFAKTRSSSPS